MVAAVHAAKNGPVLDVRHDQSVAHGADGAVR
jgi:hypothetical protein